MRFATVVADCDGLRYTTPVIPDLIDGRFRRVRELGRGGMGVVYLVEEKGRKEPIALKVLTRIYWGIRC